MIDAYEREGILFPIEVLTSEEVDRYRRSFDRLADVMGGAPRPAQLGQCHLFFRWVYELAMHPAVLDKVEEAIGPDILIHSSTLFPKYPHDPSFVSWHQDGHYWNLDAPCLISAWIALTDSTTENGCLRVVPRSHRARVPHVSHPTADNLLTSGLEVEAHVDEADALDVTLRAGTMSLHHVNLIHGSQPNRSGGMRIGVAVRYVSPLARQPGEHHAVLLARGADRAAYYEHGTPPIGDDVAGHEAFVRERRRLRETPAEAAR